MPGIEDIVARWRSYIDSLPILLKYELEEAYLKIGNNIDDLLKDYLAKKEATADDIQKYSMSILRLLQERDALIKVIEKYKEDNESNPNIPKRPVIKWLEQKKQFDVIERLKKEGVITWGTACRIEEVGFMNYLATKIDQAFKDIGLNVVGIDNEQGCYILESTRNNMIRFLSKHRLLITFCGWLIYDNEPIDKFSLENTLKICSLANEEDYYKVLQSLEALSQGLLSFDEINYEFNEVFILFKNVGQYFKADLKVLANKFKGLAVGANDVTIDNLISYVSDLPGKSYSRTEFEEFKKTRKEFNK